MTGAKLREKYRGLTNQELLQKAYDLGFNFERNSQSCSQCTVAAIHELVDIDDVVVKIATSSCGGQADQVVGTCGGLIGGTIVLDYFFGRPLKKISYKDCIQDNLDAFDFASKVAKKLYDKYIEEYGTIICPHIQVQLFGRHFYITDIDDAKKFEEAGGHSDLDKCCHIVGNASRWVMEILLDKGALS